MADFSPIIEFEPLSEIMAQVITLRGWPIIEGNIAQAFGAGKIDSNTKAVWTEDGRRVTCSATADGGFIISQSKEIDPLYTEALKSGHPANKEKS